MDRWHIAEITPPPPPHFVLTCSGHKMSRGYYTPPKHYDSQNYIWSNKDQLGSGAGGTVYVGYCKVCIYIHLSAHSHCAVCMCVIHVAYV